MRIMGRRACTDKQTRPWSSQQHAVPIASHLSSSSSENDVWAVRPVRNSMASPNSIPESHHHSWPALKRGISRSLEKLPPRPPAFLVEFALYRRMDVSASPSVARSFRASGPAEERQHHAQSAANHAMKAPTRIFFKKKHTSRTGEVETKDVRRE